MGEVRHGEGGAAEPNDQVLGGLQDSILQIEFPRGEFWAHAGDVFGIGAEDAGGDGHGVGSVGNMSVAGQSKNVPD